MNLAGLEHLAQLWRRHTATRLFLRAFTLGVLSAALAVRQSAILAAAIGLTVTLLLWWWSYRRAVKVTAAAVAAHLDRLQPALEESSSLWLREESSLTLVERLQRRRLDAAWEAQPDRAVLGQPPTKSLRSGLALSVAAEVVLALVVVWPRLAPPVVPPIPEASIRIAPFEVRRTGQSRPFLDSANLTITPPAYLAQPVRDVQGLDGEIAEGSVVRWQIGTSGDVASLALEGAEGQTPLVAEALGAGQFAAQTTLNETRLYQLVATRADQSRVTWPEMHTLKVIRDQPPRLTWKSPVTTRTIVEPSARPVFTVQLAASDDHALADVKLVMTVAKGSGEGVKFREREESLQPAAERPSERTYTRIFDLHQLGLEPGDELYLYAVATDNKTPNPNHTRSETRFVVLRGPDTALADPGTAIAGVNQMPQYFRSQRQLIIDTEKLLAEKATLPEQKFRDRSEDIGIDQKLLRLRYGQFLGEEFDPESSGAAPEARGIERATNLRTGQRAEVERSNAVDRAVEREHDHPAATPNRERPATLEEIRAPFVHDHDSNEKATLFESQVKASLRDVLAAMWEAEGLLRTVQPERALPAENRALELLKELQQADRVYVKRVGFEPAPIKLAERRLHGELDAIPKKADAPVPLPLPDLDAAAVRRTVRALAGDEVDTLPIETTTAVGQRLTAAAQTEPDKFVAALEVWRRRSTPLSSENRNKLRLALLSLLPAAEATPERIDDPSPALTKLYFNALEGSR